MHLACDVQPLERLAARHRAVADDGDDIFRASRKIARLCKPRRKADSGRCVPDVKDVVHALVRIRKTRDIAVLRFIDIRARAPREHLVRIALMRHVEDDFVPRRVKDRVECDRRLDDAEVRRDMSAVDARASDEGGPHFLCEGGACGGGIALDVLRGSDAL